jgi:acyl-lipid omega-6 desaturase (Delta-12 desaturase)
MNPRGAESPTCHAAPDCGFRRSTLDCHILMISPDAAAPCGSEHPRHLRNVLKEFEQPSRMRSILQVVTSLGGFLVLCAAMYLLADVSIWLALLPAPLAAFFVVRVFIIQHDCGHRAFFRSRRANDMLGLVCSLVTLTPYAGWRRQHAQHHGIWNNLDRRASGADIYSTCLTLEEYRALTPWQRRWYRLSRHPLVANVLVPPFVFLGLYRLPFDMPEGWESERRNVHATNLALVTLYGGLAVLLGAGEVAVIQLTIMACAAIVGVWLFSVQHRFEGVTWARQDAWNFQDAALEGSSYLRLTPVLRWLTGNIGLHHLHHLNPRIPNYALQACQNDVTGMIATRTIGLREALRATRLALWDEANETMISFAAARRSLAAPA